MSKKTQNDIPADYPVCQWSDCPLAATCLHRLVWEKLMQTETTYLQLINPGLCSKDLTCRYYRNSKPIIYARGLTNFQQHMIPTQYHTFMNLLTAQFGRTPYFERRRGDKALSPKEQEIIRAALRKAGVTEKIPFDAYEENINWYD